MVKGTYIPERGDIIWLNFSPQIGHEQQGKRPAIVISPQAYNQKTSLALLCPITTKEKGYPFEVRINNGKIHGVVLSDQIKSFDWNQRDAEFIVKSRESEMHEIMEKLSVLIFS
jgi:mRNA interferase MazF